MSFTQSMVTPSHSSAQALRDAMRLSRELGCSEASLAGLALQALDQAQAWIAVKDVASGRYLSVHTRLAALWGHSAERVVGASDLDLFDTSVAAAIRSADQSFLAHVADGLPMSSTLRMSQGGVMREFQLTRFVPLIQADAPGVQAAAEVSHQAAPPTQIVSLWIDRSTAVQRDTRLQQALQQLEQQQRQLETLEKSPAQAFSEWIPAHITPGLFDDQLRREMDLSNREHREFALVALAVDPPVCLATQSESAQPPSQPLALVQQRLLEALALMLKTNIRAMDFTCRVREGGFAVLLSGVGLATATARMEQIRRQCAAQSVVLQGQDWRFTVSMGVASFPLTALSEAALLQSAEAALTKATQSGGNQIALAAIRFQERTQAD
jgi:Diguanylate cyclase, GGDEF domain